MSRLVRKQVYITEEQDMLLKRAARRERRTEADVLRNALDTVLRPKVVQSHSGKDPLWDIVDIGRSEEGEVSRNVDHYLYGVPRR